MLQAVGRPADSLDWFARAIAVLGPFAEGDRGSVTPRQFHRNTHQGRAEAYDSLERFTEAGADWDRALALSPPPEQGSVRAGRAVSRARAGQVSEAVAEAAELTRGSGWPAGQWYNFACVYAVASGKDAAKRDEYAARAVELLRKAVAGGYNDAGHMAKDAGLAPLRDRDDFKKLLADLKAKAAKSEK
jgi:tetratricopeptide (TPR) repeat protein